MAETLQTTHTARRDALVKIERRLSSLRLRNMPETWLFSHLTPKHDLLAAAPTRLDEDKKREWARQRYETDLCAAHDAIAARLRPGAALSAAFKDGELSFSIDGAPVVERIFASASEGEFILAQWKVLAATFNITEKTDGKKLGNALRKLAAADNPAVVGQIVALEAELSALEAEITAREAEINAMIDRLYGLTEDERRLVHADGENRR